MGIAEDFAAADEFHPLHKWPAFPWRKFFFKPHKTNNERFRLWMFMFINGLPPDRCTYWVLYHGGYDKNAVSDMNNLAYRAKIKEKKFMKEVERNHVFDFNLNKVC